MNKTLAEATSYAQTLAQADLPETVQLFILPPHTALATVRAELPASSPVMIGAQNAHWASEGAYTGEISMRMAEDAGATIIEMGHSERRSMFAETDETVALKARAALDAGLVPLICVGEPGDVRAAGEEIEFLSRQVDAALSRVCSSEVRKVIVAYEPIWAIGEDGRPATVDQTAPVMAALAALLARKSDGRGPRALLYGGSVNPQNAGELLTDLTTDGLFVGRSAWQPEGLLEIAQLAAAARVPD